MLWLIKWTGISTLVGCFAFGWLVWRDLNQTEKQELKNHMLLVVDEGDSQPLRQTLKHNSLRTMKRLVRRLIVWVFSQHPAFTDIPLQPGEQQQGSSPKGHA